MQLRTDGVQWQRDGARPDFLVYRRSEESLRSFESPATADANWFQRREHDVDPLAGKQPLAAAGSAGTVRLEQRVVQDVDWQN